MAFFVSAFFAQNAVVGEFMRDAFHDHLFASFIGRGDGRFVVFCLGGDAASLILKSQLARLLRELFCQLYFAFKCHASIIADGCYPQLLD
jgi:hypothetical protein